MVSNSSIGGFKIKARPVKYVDIINLSLPTCLNFLVIFNAVQALLFNNIVGDTFELFNVLQMDETGNGIFLGSKVAMALNIKYLILVFFNKKRTISLTRSYI